MFEINGVRGSNGKPVRVRVEAASLPDAVRKAASNGVTVDPASAMVVRPTVDPAVERAEAGRTHAGERRPRVGTIAWIACGGAVAGALLVGIPLRLLGSSAALVGNEALIADVNAPSHAPTSTDVQVRQGASTHKSATQAEQERRFERQKGATYRYWSALSVELEKLRTLPSGEIAKGRRLQSIASDIAAISSLDVDTRALQIGAQWTKALRRIGEIGLYMAGDQWLLDCVRHGADGDPLWPIEERKRLENEALTLLSDVEDASTSGRHTLTQLYGVEFRPLR
ncbi:MAG: hypothetical protein BroJett004_25260 [Planctomycetota bacterium]|nr:hypothetical protein [Phycisphaerales bacterium]GIK20362.1 MAG: hypothetical protein BroJett004_25260 [Planctomycetota bacterium]